MRLGGTKAIIDATIVTSLVLLTSCAKLAPPQPQETIVDTTSHYVAWSISTLGDVTSSCSDVVITGDGASWISGVIVRLESNGNTVQYNAAYWVDTGWVVTGILFKPCVGIGSGGFDQIPAMISPTTNEIWFSDGIQFLRLSAASRDQICYPDSLQNGALLSLACGGSGDIWGVGYFGAAIHYDGQTWTAGNINTSIHLIDASESPDRQRLWACGYKDDKSESALFMHDVSGWHLIAHNPPYQGSEELFTGVWAADNDSVWVVGNVGVFRFSQKVPYGFRNYGIALSSFPRAIRGTSNSDVFVVGEQGLVLHYNGATWYKYPFASNPGDFLRRIAVTPHRVIAVGQRYTNGIENKAVIYDGRR